MAKMKRKGTSGAAKAYTSRTHAVRKLQITLADFRRLCILKGLYPVVPPNRRKANKGSSAPTTFYHTKDIQYLAHEPVLRKLREMKAFGKKLRRALGRGEWKDAEGLERNEPKSKLDHIIRERYPTFPDALRDIDDALSLLSLFSHLPSISHISPQITANCARLVAEWQLYVIRARALRKVFLSIKGVYFQAEVGGEKVTWVVPWQFTQQVPHDVDLRIMLTFLELYQTLMGFVLFKLYTQELNLVYPPPLDEAKEALAAGVGAYGLVELGAQGVEVQQEKAVEGAEGVRVGDVRRVLEGLATAGVPEAGDAPTAAGNVLVEEEMEDDLPKELPSKLVPSQTADDTPADADIDMDPPAPAPAPAVNTALFSALTIFISREVPRQTFEFILRSFGAQVGWPASSGSGSPFTETDPRITHVLMDRPTIPQGVRREGRRYVQPQWVADCVNAGRVLPEGAYEVGRGLPPHLSPFVSEGGAMYVPEEAGGEAVEVGQEEEEDVQEEDVAEDAEEEADEDEDEEEEEAEPAAVQPPKASTKASTASKPARSSEPAPAEPPKTKKPKTPAALPPALLAAAQEPTDASLLRAAELEAEAAGVSYAAFQAQLKAAAKSEKKRPQPGKTGHAKEDEDMAKIMMSNKKRKLYEKMKFGEKRRGEERERLEGRKRELLKEEGKKRKAGRA